MLYRYSLTVPASTSEDAPATAVVDVTYGVLRHVSVSFPPGCAALCHVAVRYHEVQIIPINLGAYLAWDDVTLEWPEGLPIFVPPFEFKLVGWNEDAAFGHMIAFRFDILPQELKSVGNLAARLFGAIPGFGET